VSSYRPIGLANTLYKVWTRLITNTLYKYAKTHSILSTTQAGFRKHKDTIHQLQNVIMAQEARRCQTLLQRHLCPDCWLYLSPQHHWPWPYALDHVWPWLPYWCHGCCYKSLRTCHHSSKYRFQGLHKQNIHRKGQYTRWHSLPFLFLLFMKPLLRWLHLFINISSAAFADDLLCPTGDLHNFKVQASKLTLYSDWAGLIIYTKVTGSLDASPPKDNNGLTLLKPSNINSTTNRPAHLFTT